MKTICWCKKSKAIKKVYMDGRLYEQKMMSLCYEHLLRQRKANRARYYVK